MHQMNMVDYASSLALVCNLRKQTMEKYCNMCAAPKGAAVGPNPELFALYSGQDVPIRYQTPKIMVLSKCIPGLEVNRWGQ